MAKAFQNTPIPVLVGRSVKNQVIFLHLLPEWTLNLLTLGLSTKKLLLEPIRTKHLH